MCVCQFRGVDYLVLCHSVVVLQAVGDVFADGAAEEGGGLFHHGDGVVEVGS